MNPITQRRLETKTVTRDEFQIAPLHPIDAPVANIQAEIRAFLQTLDRAIKDAEKEVNRDHVEHARLSRIRTVLYDVVHAFSNL